MKELLFDDCFLLFSVSIKKLDIEEMLLISVFDIFNFEESLLRAECSLFSFR